MSVERLIATLEKEAGERDEDLLRSARAEAEGILRTARKEADEIKQEIARINESSGLRSEEFRLGMKRQEERLKRNILENLLLEEVKEEAEKLFDAFTASEQYRMFVINAARKAADHIGGNVIFKADGRTTAHLSEAGLAAVATERPDAGFTATSADGRVTTVCDYNAIIKKIWPEVVIDYARRIGEALNHES